MEAREIIKKCMKDHGYSAAQLAEKMGYATPSGITERIRTRSRGMSVDLFVRMLDALGCELYVVGNSADGSPWQIAVSDSGTPPR